MLDAPVSGSVPQVEAGALTIMVGGDERAYARVEPTLRQLGTPTHVGDNGQGLVLKLAINISLAVQMLAFAEGLLLAERSGIDRQLAIDVMTQSPIGSPMLKARAPLVLDLPEEAWFDVGLMHKDITLREKIVVAPLVLLLLILGFYPKPVIDVINPAVEATMQDVGTTDPAPTAVANGKVAP